MNMKKYLFLIVVGTLISFSACKKENMIIGKWEIVSVEGEGIDNLTAQILKGYVFDEYYCYSIVDGSMFDGLSDNEIFGVRRYYIHKNTITFLSEMVNTPSNSMKISFSGAKKMTWKDKGTKYTLKKIS